jgi:pimeloyl-ACP methyl ester carboxylesterase
MLAPQTLWLNVSPALHRFHQPLLQTLAQHCPVTRWDYYQELDEPNSFETAVGLLHDYLQNQAAPVHLMGHGASGLLGLLYAQRYPELVKSLTLLSVGVQPAQDWQSHFYAQANVLRCSRSILLAQMVYHLFGQQSRTRTLALVQVLDRDLLTALSMHSLCQQPQLPPIPVTVPTLVCGGADDLIFSPEAFWGWQSAWRAQACTQNRVWLCPGGNYFFHHDAPKQVSEQIQAFWGGLDPVLPKHLIAQLHG